MESRGVPRISAVVWDLDDTLADTLPARVAALTRVFRDVNIEQTDPAHLLLNLEGKTLEESLLLLAASLGRPADLFDRFKSIYWTKAPGSLRLYPGVDSVLGELERRGVPMAIVTQKARSFEFNGVAAGASVEIEELGVTARFPVVIGYDDVVVTKPHPEGILKALERLGVPPERALMVGDTVADIEAAKAASCWSCLATWGIPDGAERARRTRPDLVAETPGDLLRLLFLDVGSS